MIQISLSTCIRQPSLMFVVIARDCFHNASFSSYLLMDPFTMVECYIIQGLKALEEVIYPQALGINVIRLILC